jgi:hypothetical protein
MSTCKNEFHNEYIYRRFLIMHFTILPFCQIAVINEKQKDFFVKKPPLNFKINCNKH